MMSVTDGRTMKKRSFGIMLNKDDENNPHTERVVRHGNSMI